MVVLSVPIYWAVSIYMVIRCLDIHGYIVCLTIHESHATTNKSATSNVFFFVSDLEIVYKKGINPRSQCIGQERKNIFPHELF